MRVVKASYQDEISLKQALDEACKELAKGGIIIYPTDTLYGIGCDALNEESVKKISRIKRRKKNSPFSIIVKSIEEIEKYAFLNETSRKIVEKLFPGPFTVILPKKKTIPGVVTGNSDTVGIRIPDNIFVKKLADIYGNPIVTTSVNLSQSEAVNDPKGMMKIFRKEKEKPDLLLDFGAIKNNNPSTIVDLTRKNPQIIRTGLIGGSEKVSELIRKLII